MFPMIVDMSAHFEYQEPSLRKSLDYLTKNKKAASPPFVTIQDGIEAAFIRGILPH